MDTGLTHIQDRIQDFEKRWFGGWAGEFGVILLKGG